MAKNNTKQAEIEKAKGLIEQEKTDRIKRVSEKIKQLLKDENCEMDFVVQNGAGIFLVREILNGTLGYQITSK